MSGDERTELAAVFDRMWTGEPNSGCWLWLGTIDKGGYGKLSGGPGVVGARRFRRHQQASRASWAIHQGEVPDGLCVLHSCDNRACVNPAHLFLGTHQDNSDDMVAKGRQCAGERNGHARLNTEQVAEIFASPESQHAKARRFGVARTTIQSIMERKTWRHVTCSA